MFCRNCGNKIEDTAKFCNVCGTKVELPQSASAPRKPVQQKSPKKKKLNPIVTILLLLFVVAAALSVTFNMSIPEIVTAISRGEPLKQRGFYELEYALKEMDDSVRVSQDNWDTSVCRWDNIEFFLRDYLQANPEFYYVDIRNTSFTHVEHSDNSSYGLNLAYFDELATEQAKQKLEAAANRILSGVPAGSTDWETALYLHDALIRHVTYEEGPYDQTAYGALVEGKAVCMGYTMAYEYLLTRAGIDCDTVIGYTDELSAAMDGTLFQMDQHAWTIVTFHEGGVDRSYYVDTTWDDTGLKDANGEDYVSHRWFCATQQDMDGEGRSTSQTGYDLDRWNLDDDTMNYYVYSGYMIDSYDLEEVIRIMDSQIRAGNNNPSLRMADVQTYYDLSFAIAENGDFQKLCDGLGIESCAYNFTYNYLGDGLICFDLYLNYPG